MTLVRSKRRDFLALVFTSKTKTILVNQGFQNYAPMRNRIIQLWAHNSHNSEKKCIMAHNVGKFIYKLCFFHTLRDAWNIFSHKYGTFSQQISAPSSSFSEVAFLRPPSVKWSPKSNCFQRRTLRATLHGVSTADQKEPTLKTVFLVEQSYLLSRKVNKRKKKQVHVRKTSIQKLWLNSFGLVIILEKTLLMNNQPFLLHQSPNWRPARKI